MKTIIVCLDAFRYDYLKKAKFLRELSEKYAHGKLETILGFRGIPATFLTGKMPFEHCVWTNFVFSKNSELKHYKNFNFFEGTFLENSARNLMNLDFNFNRLIKKKSFFLKIPNIPFNLMNKFEFVLNKDLGEKNILPFKTLFDFLREKKISFEYFDWPLHRVNDSVHFDLLVKNNDRSLFKHYISSIEKNNSHVYYFSFWGLDKYGHEFGPNSVQLKNKIKEIDYYCEKIFNSLRNEDSFIFWSDHGMTEVKQTVDITQKISGLDIDYFLDSTIARFKTKNKLEKEQIKKRLAGNKGHFLSNAEKKYFGINFSDSRYGNEFFLLNPGVILLPNFFQGNESAKGMHGYAPNSNGSDGIYLSSLKGKRENKKMKDCLKMCLNLIKN